MLKQSKKECCLSYNNHQIQQFKGDIVLITNNHQIEQFKGKVILIKTIRDITVITNNHQIQQYKGDPKWQVKENHSPITYQQKWNKNTHSQQFFRQFMVQSVNNHTAVFQSVENQYLKVAKTWPI